MDTEAMLDLFDNTARRWRLTGEQRADLMLQGRLHEVAARMGAISLGLGALFDEQEDAELNWLWAPREKFGGKTPLQCLLSSKEGMVTVLHLVNRERNL